MIELIVLFLVIGIIIGGTSTTAVPAIISDLRGTRKPLPHSRELYLTLELEDDEIFLPREDAPDYVFKGVLLAEKKWQERGYVEEWFQLYRMNDNRYLVCFRSKEGDLWKYWKNHPLVLKDRELRDWLYEKRRDSIKNPRAQEETKDLVRTASEYDNNLKSILFERLTV